MTVVANILNERSNTHGAFKDNANLTLEMEYLCSQAKNYHKLTDVQTMGMRMILHKLSRALSGNHNEADHWDDIAGYATLVSEDIKSEERSSIQEFAREIIESVDVEV
jgi:hypothetical protein